MPTIRVTEKTWRELNRVAKEFIEYKRIGFEDVLRISPDDTIKKLIEDWDMVDKEDLMIIEEQQRSGETDKQMREYQRKIKKQKEEGTYIDHHELYENIKKTISAQEKEGIEPDVKKIIDDLTEEAKKEAKANAKKGKGD